MVDEMATVSDAVLLAEFSRESSDAAFSVLITRHMPLVYNVCLRMLGNAHAAEDAAQATFLVLLEKSGALRREGNLGGWLYRVAVNICLRERRNRRRQKTREQEAVAMNMNAKAQDEMELAVWEKLRPELDAEVARLPEKYRRAIILFHLNGCSLKETAAELNARVGTVGEWLRRGREVLRKRLVRKGIVFSAGGLLLFLSGSAMAVEVPTSVVAGAVSMATAGMTGANSAASGLVGAKILAMKKGAINMLFWAKVKLMAVSVTAAVAVVALPLSVQAITAEPEVNPQPTVAADENATSSNQDNAADHYEKAFALLKELTEEMGEADKAIIADRDVTKVTPQLVKKLQPIMEALRRGAKAKTCDWRVENKGVGTLLPYLSESRKVIRLGVLVASYRIRSGLVDEGISDYGAVLVLSRSVFLYGGILISGLVGYSGEDVILSQLGNDLPLIPKQKLKKLEAALAVLPMRMPAAAALEGDRKQNLGYYLEKINAVRGKGAEKESQVILDFLTAATGNKKRAMMIILASGGNKGIRLALARVDQAYRARAKVLALPYEQFLVSKKKFAAATRNRNQNSLMIESFFYPLPGVAARIREAEVDARMRMLKAAIVLQRDGNTAFAKTKDPYAETPDKPFGLTKMKRGYVLSSELKVGMKNTRLAIGGVQLLPDGGVKDAEPQPDNKGDEVF